MKTCYGCGDPVPFEHLDPRDVCEKCEHSLRCCRNCAHYDPKAANDCREPKAELVADKEAGNSCEHFTFAVDRPPASSWGASVFHDLKRLFSRQKSSS